MISASKITLGLRDAATFIPLGEVVEGSGIWEDEETEYDSSAIVTHHSTSGSYSFNCDIANAGDDFIHQLAKSSENVGSKSLIITTQEYIRRPQNLKYPNKKRARRIWKKWKNRYGFVPERNMVIPNCEMRLERKLAKGGMVYSLHGTAQPPISFEEKESKL